MASYALNVPPSVPLKYILLFGTGALIMRGAGCTINDLWDRNLDNAVGAYTLNPPSLLTSRAFLNLFSFFPHFPLFFKMNDISNPARTQKERTKTRPLARGDITPHQAIAFLAPQLTAGLAVLTQLNWYRYVCCSEFTLVSLPLVVQGFLAPRGGGGGGFFEDGEESSRIIHARHASRESQHLFRRLLVVLGDNLPAHETYHLLAPSGPRCVRASSHRSHSASNHNLPSLSLSRTSPPIPVSRLPRTNTLHTPFLLSQKNKRFRVQLGCAPRLVSRFWRSPLARRGCVICGRRVLDACIR